MRKRVSLVQRNAQRAYKLALALFAGSEGFGNSWMAVIRLLTAVKMGVDIPIAHWLYFVQMANGKWQMANGKWQMANGNGQRDSALSDIQRLAFKERCPARKVPVAPGAAVSSMVTLRGVGFLGPVRLESCMAHYRIYNKQPQVASTAFVASEATLIGEVIIGERASVWPGCVIRGDNEPIRIGEGSNVQEGAVLHTDFGFPLTIAERVTIGHQAMLHGCTVGAGSLIGIQAVVMNGAVIGEGCIVGAGTLVTEGKRFPPRSLIMGVPGKVVRELGDADQAKLMQAADDYIEKGRSYLADLVRVD